jgi:hypothetical protein
MMTVPTGDTVFAYFRCSSTMGRRVSTLIGAEYVREYSCAVEMVEI